MSQYIICIIIIFVVSYLGGEINMEKKQGNTGTSFMLRVCSFIVDKRNLFFLIYAILCIFSVIAKGWVNVENDLAYYLPSDSETRQGLDLMEEQFTTYGSTKEMVANISYDQALMIQKDIKDMEGVFSCELDDSSEHYANGSAMFNITFDYDEDDEQCLAVLGQVRTYLKDYDCYESLPVPPQRLFPEWTISWKRHPKTAAPWTM